MPPINIEKFDERRIRDPVHGLIVFDGKSEIDRVAWTLIRTPEFQRLRRIKQLGFSELVYPGAAHTRFAHSIGAYYVAGQLVKAVHRFRRPDPHRAIAARLAALVHDIGHGPFSHAFEHVTKAVNQTKDHEDWSVAIITGDTDTHRILEKFSPGISEEIASLISAEEAIDIYATIVSSQFDADRLDYIQRDRIMTGVQFGHIDADWLFDCLRVGKAKIGPKDAPPEACLYLNYKGIRCAEEYLEARFRLYASVYMHKTTRAAEKLVEAGMMRFAKLANQEGRNKSNLTKFFRTKTPQLRDYLTLDDTVIWAELGTARNSRDRSLSDMSSRLLDRRLFKCFDIGPLLDRASAHEQLAEFRQRVRESFPQKEGEAPKVLEDDSSVSGYKWYDVKDQRALKKVFIQRKRDDQFPVDIAADGCSKIVRTLLETDEQIHRFYTPDKEGIAKLEKLWKGIGR